ncbi:hypothetical protein LTR49_027470 [Elasticomyces elasticus]|nr:hypothetical protein LTR49_027470 [Elasticomyces elasticus]
MSVDYATPDYHYWVFDEPSANWKDDTSSSSPEIASPLAIKDDVLNSALAPPRPALKYRGQRASRERKIKLVKDLECNIKTLVVTLASTRKKNDLLKAELSRFKRGMVVTRFSSSRHVCPIMCPGIGAEACGFGGSYLVEEFVPWQSARDDPFIGSPVGFPSP